MLELGDPEGMLVGWDDVGRYVGAEDGNCVGGSVG